MPWRLISLIIIFAVLLAFITFNLENKCDISFGIKVFHDIPVFLTIFASFVFGLLFALPLKFRKGKKRNEVLKNKKQEIKPIKNDFPGHKDGDYGID